MLDIVTLWCNKLGVHGTATRHHTLKGPVFWTGALRAGGPEVRAPCSPCPSDRRTLDQHRHPRFPVPSLERSTSTTFLPLLGASGEPAGETAGCSRDLAFDSMPFRSLAGRKFTEDDRLRAGQRASGCRVTGKPGPCPLSTVQGGGRLQPDSHADK